MSADHLPGTALDQAVHAMPDDALAPARRAALARFSERGFPTTREEDWKYTDLSGVVEISRRWLSAPHAEAKPDAASIRDIQARIDADWVVITNGRIAEEFSGALRADGLTIGRLDAAAGESQTSDPLADLNLALLEDGISIRITSDRFEHRPLAFLIVDAADAAPVSSQVRIDIAVTAGAAARFVEYHLSSGDNEHYSNALLNLALGDGARADYLRLQDRARNHSQTARLDARLGRDSSLHHFALDVGGRLARNDLRIELAGKGAMATFNGLYVVRDGQHVDNHTRVDHRIGPATSRQEYRGILSGRSRAVWNGKAIVYKGADGTDAEQANHNLLLSEKAEVDAKPELEIYADEVKCAHGTTIGQLDERALYYLRTRGLLREHAERVLTRAFAASVVKTSPIPEAHELMRRRVEERLSNIVDGDAE